MERANSSALLVNPILVMRCRIHFHHSIRLAARAFARFSLHPRLSEARAGVRRQQNTSASCVLKKPPRKHGMAFVPIIETRHRRSARRESCSSATLRHCGRVFRTRVALG
ncbi:hypothetical protein MPTK1_5g08080 [Marchantia polymorpha subsp. ruderalis]|uniref:Uncharacterized protein n=2 Tax=Marchantia polymorpha TaxID=3197 RepID=A0AAF6BG42_MARPO|nr:hypothetical protein MARPO_0086s0012 [Marchantia polymorpha]BBN10976.1 hypothetical protein Mp_5g08080 [Marchantia polymorpha subsp. ruderalis]|eukprot:PTQ33674.1 hypothetical protein MARPO_0086s0012 [Marchantia polymorpha]